MEAKDLIHSCRLGDLQKVRYLVEQKETNVNVRDKWDSTPLYYACLCGHEELVQYLLENGARCEANTFDGERCLYGALTNSIRKLLISYNAVSSKMIRRDLYEEFLRRLLETGLCEDLVFNIHGFEIPGHRCILSARCSYFAELFRTRWLGKRDIRLKHKLIAPAAFKSIMQYLYTGQLETHVDYIEDCIRLAKQCRLTHLEDLIKDKTKKVVEFEFQKPGVNVTTLATEFGPAEALNLQLNFGHLAHLALPQELCSISAGELPFEPEFASIYADIVFLVEGHKFLCHKAFFCGRSDYFKALLVDHFGESSTSEDDLPVIPIHNISTDIFIQVLYYIYQDNCELTEETVYDVLCAADLYLLPGLKRLCANCIAQYLQVNNVVQILRTARLFNLPRLEDQCASFIANNIEEVITSEEFASVVQEDAKEVQQREEADTIDIIDSVRFHITNFMTTFSEMQEAEEKLRLIDQLLEELGLEG